MAVYPSGTNVYATLPHPGRMQYGDHNYTKDVGEVWTDGTYWYAMSGTFPIGLFASLPNLAALTNAASGTVLPVGAQAQTVDQGLAVWGGSTWSPLTGGGLTVRNKIRAAMAAAAGGQNPAERPPLLAPPAWVAATAYIVGQVVTNSGGGAGNLYVCSVSGTSAGSGGPTGQAAATIVDNTASWQYFGPVKTVTSSALAPTVSFAAYNTVGSASYFWYSSSQTYAQATPGNANFFHFDGAYPQAATLSGGATGASFYGQLGASNSGATTVGGITSNYWANSSGIVTFYTDAPKVMIGGAVNVGSSFASGGYVEIDDVPLSDSPFFNTANSGYGLLIDFTAVGGRKTRKYRIHHTNFTGVSTFDNISQVWAYTPANEYKIAWIGDSISAGSGGGPFGEINYSSMARFCRFVGNEHFFNQAVGGMGFANPINGYTFQTAAASLALDPPDVLIICGNYDDNAYTSPQRQAAVVAFLTWFRATYPKAMVIGFGPWGGTQNGSAAWLLLEADMQAGFATFNDPNMFFIPLMNRPSGLPWVSGTGTIAAPVGGNSSEYVYSDGTHPTALAHKDYIPRVYAEAFKNLMNTLPY